MIIGYDAKRAFQNFTGLGNYSRTLVESLATYFPEHQYHLFAPRDSNSNRLQFIKQHPSVFTHFPASFLRKTPALWRTFNMSNDIKAQGVQIFHGLSHELPYGLPNSIKKVVTIHDLIHERFPEFYPYFDRKVYSLKFKSACQRADRIVAISEQTKQDLVEFYSIEPEKIKVIYQSCDPQFSVPPQYFSDIKQNEQAIFRKKYQLETPYILYVGSINQRKNLLGLLKAFTLVENKEIKLVIIGKMHKSTHHPDGQYAAKVKSFIAENKLSSRIIFKEDVAFELLPNFYAAAELLALPSFFEGFGIPIIEALWSGCPVVTTEGGCFIEAGGTHSIYINPNEAISIAAGINQVLNNRDLATLMRQKGYEFVQKFSNEQISKDWIDLYKNL